LTENALCFDDSFSAEESIATVVTNFLIWEDSEVDRRYTAPIKMCYLVLKTRLLRFLPLA